jgi:hypothetical protein
MNIMTRQNQFRILFTICGLVLLLAGLLPLGRALAQTEDQLKIRLSRNFGYSSGMGSIQGTFTIKASGPPELEQVFFYLDDVELGEVRQEPFNLRFQTDDYDLGAHTLHAVGYTSDGRQLESNTITVTFVSAEEGWQAALRIMVPILVLVFGFMILSFVFTIITGRQEKNLPPGTPRRYGISGGAICSRCGRPFARHWYAPNLAVGKLERCPFCGKWSVVSAVPLYQLRAAEQEELEAAQNSNHTKPLSEEERLRKELDDSRYQDL